MHYSRDKADFKKAWKKMGVPLADDYFISPELKDEELDNIKYPVVVKPVDCCANTGISALIDAHGHVLERTAWWQPALLKGSLHLYTRETFFVRWGDIPGRACVLVFLLLLSAALFRPRRG